MEAAAKQIANDADALYTKAAAHPPDEKGLRSKMFEQDELMKLAGTDSADVLRSLISYLSDKGLFRTLKQQGKLIWSARPREAARQIVRLDREERVVYEIIEESHTQGIWVKELKRKAGIAGNAVTKYLSKMEKANLIKGVKSIKSPAQRTYMLAHLTPSEDVTGNSFFDAGDLDESFRDELMNLIVFWVRQNSWAENRKKHRRDREPSSPILISDEQDATGKKRKRTADIEDIGGRPKYRVAKFKPDMEFTQLIHRAGSHNYPTAQEIHAFLASTDAIKPAKAASLTVQEIQGCIDVLCWDDKLEKVPNNDGIASGYRTVRGVTFKPPTQAFEEYEEHPGNGLTQSPCGRCPVFDLCHYDGPVNPQDCVYFDQWLKA